MLPSASLSFLGLPVELLIQILSHLDVSDLNNIANTCQHLNHIINDEELWKNLFIKRFNTHHFSSISKSFKFSTELFERNEKIHKWRKATGMHKTITINGPTSEKLIFTYPRVLSLNEQGAIDVLSVEKSKNEASIPTPTPRTCAAYSITPLAFVFGKYDGKVLGKLLASKSYLTSVTKFDKEHESAVVSIYNDDSKCYSGDEKGFVFVWDLKNGLFTKEYKVSTKPILQIKGLNELIIACDETDIYIIENEKVRSITHNKAIRSLDVDYAGKTIVITELSSVILYSFNTSNFGRSSSLKLNSQIQCLSLEDKCFNNRDTRIAGYDGCNLGIVTNLGEVLVINIRHVKLNSENQINPHVRMSPIFDNLKIPNGWPTICSIAVNSSVVLLGSYNGFSAAYDALTGEFLRLVSSKISKRYLPLTEGNYFIPVKSVLLGERNKTHGVLLVNNVLQYFQFGEFSLKFDKKKFKNKLAGASSERKDKMKKKIKHEIDEMEHEEFENFKAEMLLNKYNGETLTEEEQIQLAIVLNKSIHDKHNPHATCKENLDLDNEIDGDLAKALELSRLETKSSVNTCHASNRAESFKVMKDSIKAESYGDDLSKALELSRLQNGDSGMIGSTLSFVEPVENGTKNLEDDFEEQLKEAMRRSLYE